MTSQFRAFVLSAVVLLLSQATLLADVTGSILGSVTDATSAVVQGAKVTVTNQDTNQTTEAVTDAQGQYRILALSVGRYRLQVSMSGFQTYVETGIVLEVNSQRQVNVSLKVGDSTQQISVTADALQVETTNTQLGQVIGEKQILELPLNGRGYLDLLGLQPGVAPAGTRNEGAGTVSVNGQRENSNGFLVNGGDVNGVGNFEAQIQPNLDAIQEFRLITNGFDAEYGRFSGAITNSITKSGNNSIHGSAFEFLRNDKMDARGFFDSGKGALKRNQFGYAVGGPIKKDKLFWFTDYQGTRQVDGGSADAIQVPTTAERQGSVDPANLTGSVTGSYWAQVLSARLGYTVTDGEPYTAVFPGGVIPEKAFSSATKGTLPFIPLPNTGADIYASAAASIRTHDNMTGQRVDFLNNLTGNWSGYYYYDGTSVLNPYGGSSFPGFASDNAGKRQQAVLSNTKILGPTAVNEVRLNFTRIRSQNAPVGSAPSLGELGFITGANTLGINPSAPSGVTGVPNIGLNNFGFGSSDASISAQNTYQIADNFSKVFGRHSLKFGGEFRYYQMNQRNGGAGFGGFNFDGGETGYDVADYLIGAPVSFSQNSLQLLDSRSKYGGAYAQDSFRVSGNLTINFGLRWEFSQPWYDTQDKIVALVAGQQSTQYPTAPRGLVYPGDAGVARTLAPTRYGNFAPRLGIAYSPSASGGTLRKILGEPGRTSIRIGSGLFYTAVQDQTLFWILGTAPFGEYWGSSAPPLFEEPFRSRATGESQGQKFPFVIPAPGSPAAKNFDFSPYLPLVSTLGYDIHNKLPYGISYNATIQRQISGSMVVSLGYVGTLGRKLIGIQEANPGNPALCLSLRGSGVMEGTLQCGPNLADATFTRPDGTLVHGTRGPFGSNFGTTFQEGNWANSDYNSFQTSLERRSGNMTFLLGYTWSKAMGNGSYFNDRMNFSNHALSRGLSNFDITHNFVASYTYALPFDKAFRALPKRLVQGWSIAGVSRFSTGFPVFVFAAGDGSLYGTSGIDRPNRTGPLTIVADPRGPEHRWFKNDAFTVAPMGTLGNSSARFFHGPGLNNWNLSLHKDTRLTEAMRIQIRAEFFNALNHAQFGSPNGFFNTNTNSAFGRISSAGAPRVGQLGAKFIF